jgi:hypothetical protein
MSFELVSQIVSALEIKRVALEDAKTKKKVKLEPTKTPASYTL